MRIKPFITMFCLSIISAIPVQAFSAAQISIDNIAEKQEVIITNGEKQISYIESDNVSPGDTIRFTLRFRNNGDEDAPNVNLVNPFPEGTSYVANSATVFDNIKPLFSIDGGKSFKQPTLLIYEREKPGGGTETVVATPEIYTHIRWQIPLVAAGDDGQVSFNVIVQ